MGLGDKFKDLKKQAQKSVAEHRDQIEDAVGAAGMVVDQKTKGRHTQKIAKFGQKASQAVDKFADEDEAKADATPGATEHASPAAARDETPGATQTATPSATGGDSSPQN